MTTINPATQLQPHRSAFGLRRVLLAVLAVFSLAISSAHADVVFTRTTVTSEPWALYTATFTPSISGNYSLGFNLTAGGPSGDNSILIDTVSVTRGATTVFSDGFETPAIATNAGLSANGGTATIGNWTYTNWSGVLDGSPPNWGLSSQGLGSADGTTQYAYLQAAVATLSTAKANTTLALTAGQTYTVSFYQASRRDFGGTVTYTVTLDYVPPTVFASGISEVIAYDPIFPAAAYPNWTLYATPTPAVGYNANWVNPHPATAFPIGSHPWEFATNYDFAANWINAWSDLSSRGPSGHSWTKYTTTVTGEGDFVLQFLADNASWIYIDGQLVGYQDLNWNINGTGRYTIRLTGSGPHELCFIILDGGGAAGGKFRLETTASFVANNPGEALPPPADSTPPVISAPGSIVTEATGPLGATVNFSASAVDANDGPVTVVASPASGSVFPLGTTSVGLAASDAAGNTASAAFAVTVNDTTAPVIASAATVGPIEASGPAGASVPFAVPGAFDLVDGNVAVSASPAPGSTFPLGLSSVTLSAADSRGNSSTRPLFVQVVDTTAPVIAAPADITAEATSADGASVDYVAQANDLVAGNVAITGTPASGSTFPLGTTAVTLSAADGFGNAATAAFNITVQDTTAPVITAPADQTLEASDATGAVATFEATATDAVGVTALTYSPTSGSTFPLGATPVTVTATDAAGNSSTATFTITVQDTTPAVITAPAPIIAEATGDTGTIVTYSASALDAVDGTVSVSGSPASGSTFPLGTTTVTLSSTDSQGNTSTASFAVTVLDTTAPSLTAPAAQVLEASDATGAIATFAAAATDAVGVTSLTYSQASGSVFPLGTTTVTVTATDAAGNSTSADFSVTVRDTTAPSLTVPANQVIEATSAAGAIASYAANASDAVGVTAINYSIAPGSLFPLGTTTVNVEASDAAGNVTSGAFTVTVSDTTAPTISSLTATPATLWPVNHKLVNIQLSAIATDLVGVTSLRIINVTSSEPDNGCGDGDTPNDIQITGDLTLKLRAERDGRRSGRTYTITVEARDAAGNVTLATTTVSVPKSQGGGKDDDEREDDKGSKDHDRDGKKDHDRDDKKGSDHKDGGKKDDRDNRDKGKDGRRG